MQNPIRNITPRLKLADALDSGWVQHYPKLDSYAIPHGMRQTSMFVLIRYLRIASWPLPGRPCLMKRAS